MPTRALGGLQFTAMSGVTSLALDAGGAEDIVLSATFTSPRTENALVLLLGSWLLGLATRNFTARYRVYLDGALNTNFPIQRWNTADGNDTRASASGAIVLYNLSVGSHTVQARVQTFGGHTDTTGKLEEIAGWVFRR